MAGTAATVGDRRRPELRSWGSSLARVLVAGPGLGALAGAVSILLAWFGITVVGLAFAVLAAPAGWFGPADTFGGDDLAGWVAALPIVVIAAVVAAVVGAAAGLVLALPVGVVARWLAGRGAPVGVVTAAGAAIGAAGWIALAVGYLLAETGPATGDDPLLDGTLLALVLAMALAPAAAAGLTGRLACYRPDPEPVWPVHPGTAGGVTSPAWR